MKDSMKWDDKAQELRSGGKEDLLLSLKLGLHAPISVCILVMGMINQLTKYSIDNTYKIQIT